MADQSILRRLELNHAHFRSLHVKIVSYFDLFGVGNEVGFPDRLQADGVKFLAGCEIAIFAAEALGEIKGAVEDEFGIAVKIERDRRGGDSDQPDRLIAAVDQTVPGIQMRGEEAPG